MSKNDPVLRHAFRWRTHGGKPKTDWYKVIAGKEDVEITLTEEHVLESLRRRGIGDTQNCSGAVCLQKHADSFSHDVEGTVDWFPSRCFMVSKVYDEPRRLRRGSEKFVRGECHAYLHRTKFWQINDSIGGHEKLLKYIRKNGPITVHLSPWRKQTQPYSSDHRGSKKDGTRNAQKIKGAAHRIAFVQAQKASA